MSNCDCPECRRRQAFAESQEIGDAMKTRCHECPVKKEAKYFQELSAELRELISEAAGVLLRRQLEDGHGETAVEYLSRLAQEVKEEETQ